MEIDNIELIQCEQGSDVWYESRAGAITASMFSTIRQTLKSGPNKGSYRKEAEDYAFRLAAERISGSALQDDQFETYAMRRGHALEPMARARHAELIGCEIEEIGLVRTTDGRFGASADGLIESLDAGSEYKCFTSPEKLRVILLDRDLSGVMDQIQGGMWLTGLPQWHFALYCPALEPVGKDIAIHEVPRDDNYIEALEADIVAFDRHVEAYREQIEAADNYIGAKGVF